MADDIAILLLAAFGLLGTPGPAPVALAAAGAGYGYRASLPFYGGVMAGLFAAMVLSALGITALIALVPAAAVVLLGVSLAYVLYLAWRIATAPPMDGAAGGRGKPSLADGFVINILNPKVYAAFATLYASFTPPGLAPPAATAIAGMTGFLVALGMNQLWLLAGEGLSRLFSRPRQNRVIRIVLAGAMVSAVLAAVYKLARSGLF